MRSARKAAYVGVSFNSNERLRFDFQADDLDFSVHAVFHDAPELSTSIWNACTQVLAVSCLVDVATACLAKETIVRPLTLGPSGSSYFNHVAEALRLEMLAENRLSVTLRKSRLRGLGRPQETVKIDKPIKNRVMLLMGGGKDSLYTYYLLRSSGYDVQCFYLVEARRSWQQLRHVYHALDGEVAQHRVFLNVNQRGRIEEVYGDVYRSQFEIGQAIAASLPYVIANRCEFVALGLEKSSDIPMMFYRGKPVNHQHQKSSSSIKQLNRYLGWLFEPGLRIVSPLHGLYDTGIYARFLNSDRNLVRLQSSCAGANYLIRHCGQCDKCAFLAALFAGLSSDKTLYKHLFPRDPMLDPELYSSWIDSSDERPLTCAGLKGEVRIGLRMAIARGWRRPILDQCARNSLATDNGKGLKYYLKSHANPLSPNSMKKRFTDPLKMSPALLSDLVVAGSEFS